MKAAYKFAPAKREAVPTIISVTGKSGSGKTKSSLLLARGLAGPKGRVGVIDTENKRSLVFAQDKDIGGFEVLHLYPPFTSQVFIDAIDAAEDAGFDVLVIDSASHEWSGIGGIKDQVDEKEVAYAARNKGREMGVRAWQKPKFAHRRWVNRLLQAQMHVILCLRGDEKLVKTKVDGREIFVEGPIVPEQEKRLIFEMTLQAMLEVGTNKVSWTKIPGQLRPALPDGVVITAATGAAIRDWVNEGVAVDLEFERLVSVSRSAAGFGAAAYRGYWDKLPADQKKRLLAHHEEFKAIAAASDTIAVEDEEEAEAEQGDPFAPIGG